MNAGDGIRAGAAGVSSGPLTGVRVVEIGAIGPGPFAAMMLADMGADVARVERMGSGGGLGQGAWNLTNRNRPSVAVDLKAPGGAGVVLDLVERADALIEGFRPGVMSGSDSVQRRRSPATRGSSTGG